MIFLPDLEETYSVKRNLTFIEFIKRYLNKAKEAIFVSNNKIRLWSQRLVPYDTIKNQISCCYSR